jgi:hypothetical protein
MKGAAGDELDHLIPITDRVAISPAIQASISDSGHASLLLISAYGDFAAGRREQKVASIERRQAFQDRDSPKDKPENTEAAAPA